MAFEVPLVNSREVGIFRLRSYSSDGEVFYGHNEANGFFYDVNDKKGEVSLDSFRHQLRSSIEKRGYSCFNPTVPTSHPFPFSIPGVDVAEWATLVHATVDGVKVKAHGNYNPNNTDDVKDYRRFLEKFEEALEEVSFSIKS